jgi:antirestriction protein ArdC
LFVSKEYQNRGLDGWKDDKEKFKIDLLNDIKTFLFGKWEKPWIPSLIFDSKNKIVSGFRNVTERVYHNSSNILSLERNCGDSPYFITLQRLNSKGGKILDKTKITSVISYIPIFKEKEVKATSGLDDSAKPDFMLPKFHPVINVDFTEGITKPKYKTIDFVNHELNEYVENFIEELKKRKRIPKLVYDESDRCYYVHSLDYSKDEIHLVKIGQFKKINEYYSTLFHEIVHSTKAASRLGQRDKKNKSNLAYANEELVAEMGALILCSELGLEYTRQNSLAYLKSWLSGIKANSDDAMIEAYAFACDAAEYLLADIELEALVPKSMVKRAEENPIETEPGTAKPDGKKSISPTEKKPVKTDIEPTKDKEPKKDKPEVGRNTASFEPKFNEGDRVSMFPDEPELKVIKVNTWEDKSPTYDLVSDNGEIERNNIPENKLERVKENPKPEKNYYIINEDRKVEMYFGIEDYKKLPDNDRSEIKRYFLWSRFKKAWISKAKNSYHVENFAKRLGLTFYEKKKLRSFEDEIQRKKDKAASSIDKLDTRKENALKRAASLQSEFNRLRQDWSWLTQPILKGHSGSERFGRSKARVIANYKKSFQEYDKVKYYEQKQKLAEETLKDTKLKDIHYIQNRVKEAEKSIRKISQWVSDYQKKVESGNLTDEQKEKYLNAIDEGLQRLQYNYDKLAYYKLAESVLLENNTGSNAVVFNKDLSMKLAKFLKKHFAKLYNTEILSTTSTHFITVRNPKGLPVELRKSVATLFYPGQIERINEGIYDIGSINPTYISLYPKEWHKYLLSTGVNFMDDGNEPTPEKPKYKGRPSNREKTIENIRKNPPTEKTSTKVDIVDISINEIYTDEKRFQNRKNAYSEDSKNRIINAVTNGTFDWAKFDPVLLWFDPSAKRNYVLSGHSRYAAFKELATVNNDFSKIPSRFFKGTEAEAIDIALNSNTLSTKETEVERAMYYNRQRNKCEMKNLKGLGAKTDCEKEVETACREAEGKNANYILNLSYLNPEGYLIDTLSRLGAEKDNDSTNVLRTIANWIGEARRKNPQILNEQETEIAQFLLNGGYGNKTGQFRNKEQFIERLDYSFNKWMVRGANPSDALNLANTLSKSSFEKEYDERLANARQVLDDAINEHEEKYKKYLFSVMDGSMTQERMDELMKPIIGWVSKARTEYSRISGQKDEVKKAASAQTSLFGFRNIGKVEKSTAIKLSGELGEFLGGYERKQYSIALRGDKGAGKTRLVYQLLDLFASQGLKCAFMSLEMPVSSSITSNYLKEYIKPENRKRIDISDETANYFYLDGVCKMYDVVVIDSWTKLKGVSQDDFDRLQKDNPQTIIIAIFQATTGRVTRGGNMPEYDAAVVIHVHKGGVAVCEKNRYTATDTEYLVFEQKLRVEEPTEAD